MAWISAEQCRAARALLLWSQSELAARANVAKQTIQHFEIGKRQPYKRTLDDIVEALTLAGVEFIEPVPGKHVGGVVLRCGFEPARPDATTSAAKGEAHGEGGASAAAWDDDDAADLDEARLAEMAAALRETQPLVLTEEERRAMAEHYRAQPERWAALREISRQALLQAMGLERLG